MTIPGVDMSGAKNRPAYVWDASMPQCSSNLTATTGDNNYRDETLEQVPPVSS
jgi:hypothetical protein